MESPVDKDTRQSSRFRDGVSYHIIFLVMWLILFILGIYLGSAYYRWTETANARDDPGVIVSNYINVNVHEFALLVLQNIFYLLPLVAFLFYFNWRRIVGDAKRGDEKNVILWYVVMLVFVLAMLARFIGLIFVATGCNSPDHPYNICNSPYYCCKYANTTSCPNDYACPGYDVDTPLSPRWYYIVDFVFTGVLLILLFIYMLLYKTWVFDTAFALVHLERMSYDGDLQPRDSPTKRPPTTKARKRLDDSDTDVSIWLK